MVSMLPADMLACLPDVLPPAVLERFLNSLAQQQQDAGSSGAAGQAAAPRQDLGWVAPVLFVLLQSPLNSETASYGSKLLLRIWCAGCLLTDAAVPTDHCMRFCCSSVAQRFEQAACLLAPVLCSRILAVTLPGQERLAVRRALQALLSWLPADVLAARCVRPVQRYIDSCVHAGLGATRVQVCGVQCTVCTCAGCLEI